MRSIKGNNFIVRYDDEKRILYGILGAEVTSETIARLFMAIIQLLRDVDVSSIRAIEYDMRRVESFGRNSLAMMQRESYRLNTKHNLSHIPVAYIVDSVTQETTANLIMQITPDKDRNAIVFSMAEAHAFVDEWYYQANAST